jgi:ATP-binding cassette subfamily G (WHITE) protein 2 (PDR)
MLTMDRNFGVIIAITVFFTVTYLLATEYISSKKSKGEILIFQRGRHSSVQNKDDLEKPTQPHGPDGGLIGDLPLNISGNIHRQTSIFQWKNICYDIKIKKEDRRILNCVDGWVKPGTLTALMVSCVCRFFRMPQLERIDLEGIVRTR